MERMCGCVRAGAWEGQQGQDIARAVTAGSSWLRGSPCTAPTHVPLTGQAVRVPTRAGGGGAAVPVQPHAPGGKYGCVGMCISGWAEQLFRYSLMRLEVSMGVWACVLAGGRRSCSGTASCAWRWVLVRAGGSLRIRGRAGHHFLCSPSAWRCVEMCARLSL